MQKEQFEQIPHLISWLDQDIGLAQIKAKAGKIFVTQKWEKLDCSGSSHVLLTQPVFLVASLLLSSLLVIRDMRLYNSLVSCGMG